MQMAAVDSQCILHTTLARVREKRVVAVKNEARLVHEPKYWNGHYEPGLGPAFTSHISGAPYGTTYFMYCEAYGYISVHKAT